MNVHQLSKNETSRHAIMNSPQVGKMNKAVSEANKLSDELKKTKETLNIATNRNDQLQVEHFLLIKKSFIF